MAIADTTYYKLSGAQLSDLKDRVQEAANNPKNKSGSADPTTSTAADFVGQLYINTTSNQIFYCSAIAGNTYTWTKTSITVGEGVLTIAKNGTSVGTFSANATANKTIDIEVPTTAADVDALPDTTKYAAALNLSVDNTTYVVTAQLKDQDGANLGTAQTIDLPLESVVVNGSYDSTNKKIVLTLQSGSTIDIPVADLVSGLQSEITSTNKLSADLVDDSESANKFVTAANKTTWNNKQDKLIAGSNVTIASDGKTISASNTTYGAGTGLVLSGTTFSVDTNTVALKSDLASTISDSDWNALWA